MPQLLAARVLNAGDSVARFEKAAKHRFTDAERLFSQRRLLAAVYLYGYSVEMWLKAALYRAVGNDDHAAIRESDRRACEALVRPHVPPTIGPLGHYLPGWAVALVQGSTTISVVNQRAVANKATRLYLMWREILRYAPNVPSAAETTEVREIASWFRTKYARSLRGKP